MLFALMTVPMLDLFVQNQEMLLMAECSKEHLLWFSWSKQSEVNRRTSQFAYIYSFYLQKTMHSNTYLNKNTKANERERGWERQAEWCTGEGRGREEKSKTQRIQKYTSSSRGPKHVSIIKTNSFENSFIS